MKLLPPGVRPGARAVLLPRGLRAVADGCVAVLLPVYLLALGYGTFEVGVIATATLLGSALATLALGAWGHRWPERGLLLAAAVLMAATGTAFALVPAAAPLWPLLVVAFVGTLNAGSGDVSVFLPLEHARLAALGEGEARTALFARYSLIGALGAALGALLAGVPDALQGVAGMTPLDALRAVFAGYAGVGIAVWWLYHRAPAMTAQAGAAAARPLGPSRKIVARLTALFAVDAFAGGLVVNTLMALWLFARFEVSATAAGAFFFWAGLLAACSQLAAPAVARRIGLVNTMVFTHLPANVCLVAAALAPTLPMAIALLSVRALLSQMDVPTRSAFVMAVVTPAERAAAASATTVPRSLAAAVGPILGGAWFATGALAAPLVVGGLLKIVYDIAVWLAFRHVERRL